MTGTSQTIQSYTSTVQFGERPSALIFDHMHKCAGTTFHMAMHAALGEIFNAYVLSLWKQLAVELPACKKKLFAVAGHATLGLHEYLPPGCNAYYITVLREPVDRIISSYRFHRAWYAPETSLNEYLEHVQSNYLVHRLGSGDLSLAKERLKNFYYLFGLTERFNDFLVMLKVHTGLDLRACHSVNRTESGASAPPDIIEELHRRNVLDLELYRWAYGEFDRRMALVQPDTTPPTPLKHTAKDPMEIVRTSKTIRDLLDQHQYIQAAAEIAKLIRPDNGPTARYMLPLALANIHHRAGDIKSASRWYETSLLSNAEAVLPYAQMLEKTDPERALRVLQGTLDSLQDIHSAMSDSCVNRFRRIAQSWAVRLAYQTGHFPVEKHVKAVWASLPAQGITKVAVFGAGKHTAWLSQITGETPGPQVVAVLDEQSLSTPYWNLRPIAPATWNPATAQAVILSSDAVQKSMTERCRHLFGDLVHVINLYDGLPPGPYAKTIRTNPLTTDKAHCSRHDTFP